jgi:hypothetical protein
MVLLYAKGQSGNAAEPIRGRVRLMKMIFLFDKEIRKSFNLKTAVAKEALPNFEPFDYGPYSHLARLWPRPGLVLTQQGWRNSDSH